MVHEDFLKEYGHQINLQEFRENLIAWGKDNFREFPWRFTSDPYHILMAEVMLHRTQAGQVVPVYERFMKAYPTLPKLAQATEDEIYEALKSLGLIWRINLILKMAQTLMTFHQGRVPCNKESLLTLPGVSDYIASAVRCFAWNERDALIDTNIVRITSRLFGIEEKDSLRRNSQFKKLIHNLVDSDHCKDCNYALLDLANAICTKKRPPDCINCPILEHCSTGTSRLTSSASRRID